MSQPNAADVEQKFTAMKQETKKLFEAMRQIMQNQALQMISQSRDIERIDSQLENMRPSGNNLNKDEELDLVKKMIAMEREFTQLAKD